MAKVMERAHYMTAEQKKLMGRSPRRHSICRFKLAKRNEEDKITQLGPARPGKTAQDRARRGK